MEQRINIKEMSEIELKALAHDEMIKRDAAQQNINIIHQELAMRLNGVKEGQLKNDPVQEVELN